MTDSTRPPAPGSSAWRLLDERHGQSHGPGSGQDPGGTSLRQRIGALLAGARSADFAVARIRLAGIDLSAAELAGVERCRVLLGELDASTLADAAESGVVPARRAALGRLLAFARSGRLQVRSAGLGAWMPDFAIIGAPTGPPTTLLGAIYLGPPYLTVGPSLTCVTHSPMAAALAAPRFDELWERGHDVLPAIIEVLERYGAVDD